jgi:hypothetical protein
LFCPFFPGERGAEMFAPFPLCMCLSLALSRPTDGGALRRKRGQLMPVESKCSHLNFKTAQRAKCFQPGPLPAVIGLVWHPSLLYNFSPVTMVTCFSVAAIVNQDLSLFPFHHEALYPYGLNHSSHWQWHRSNIIARHKTRGAACHLPPITRSGEHSLKSNFYKEIGAPLAANGYLQTGFQPTLF